MHIKQIVIKVSVTHGLGPSFLNFSEHQNHLEGSFKHRLPSFYPRVSGSVGLGWDVKFYISHKFSGATDATGIGLTF